MIKVIIAGGRDFNDYKLLKDAASKFLHGCTLDDITIISGKAKGADSLAIKLAREYGLDLITKPADWDKYGRSAGFIRNVEMADIATHLLAFWDGKSRGTRHMIETAKTKGLIIKVVYYGPS